ncbi:STAS domain-containing protein [Spirilliplanes yamanashiensis]|uniref:Anti-sigma factor antagonist n=1 Tax=Spirilliplanes yamanashiensis TaxID=42233 RepID=A0A8J3Y9E5_9ACTN|nr:STAS domain-containing protein [Spirilliplanes yamanashiensis]MDP9815695.1 anti-sigma B factor antagonist [Spirilliplanes yamanashiensis]GIJ03949.1 anti-sigma factor antagonist [Spirilliplanes yamanashiensis]
MTPEILALTVRDLGDTGRVLTATGEIDHDTRAAVRDAVMESVDAGRTRVVLDVAGVEFCDSGALSAFVEAHRRTEAAGGWFRLAGASGRVQLVLRLANLDRILQLRPTVAEATADL